MAVAKSNSFLTFVYPITLDSGNFDAVVGTVDAAAINGDELKIWEQKNDEFPHDELLPHVADYLKLNDEPTARLWQMSDAAFTSPKGLGAGADWRLVFGKNREVPFQFDCVNLFLFRVGVGFLAFRVRPKSGDLADWLDLLHYFRLVKREHYLTARRKTGKDSYEDFFPPLAAPKKDANADAQIETTDEKKGTLSQIIQGLLKITGDEKNLPSVWWDEIFIHNQMLGYAAMFVEGLAADEHFKLLYKLRNFFPGDKEIYPSTYDLNPQNPSLLEYGNRQWFTFSLEGGGFLACDAPDNQFFNSTLPDHIRKQYFHLYIIALHQRFALMSMSHEVTGKWTEKSKGGERVEAFKRIRGKFLAFTARGYFAQVMQREHHHRCYRKWQETFELQRIYDEVREEVREMFEWLQLKAAEEQADLTKRETEEAARREREEKERDAKLAREETRREREAKERTEKLAGEEARREREAKERADKLELRVSLFGLLIALGIGIPALVTGFFGMNFAEGEINLGLLPAVIWFFGAVVTSVSVALLIYFYMNRQQKSDKNNIPEGENKMSEENKT